MLDSHSSSSGTLYIVPTPIGNLADMVPRAIEVLQSASVIAAEDTRHSAKLLQHFQIDTPMQAYHDHSDQHRVEQLLQVLVRGDDLALISDAGTPLVSDPGFRLVREARERGIRVCPIPGACAAIAALSASGLPSDRFSFEGFPPAKSGARSNYFTELAQDPRTLVFYESPHRIEASLIDLAGAFGADRELVLAREISKAFETFLYGSVSEVLAKVSADANQRRGEIVLLVRGFQKEVSKEQVSVEAQRVMQILLADKIPTKQVAALASKITGEKKNKLYSWVLESTKGDNND